MRDMKDGYYQALMAGADSHLVNHGRLSKISVALIGASCFMCGAIVATFVSTSAVQSSTAGQSTNLLGISSLGSKPAQLNQPARLAAQKSARPTGVFRSPWIAQTPSSMLPKRMVNQHAAGGENVQRATIEAPPRENGLMSGLRAPEVSPIFADGVYEGAEMSGADIMMAALEVGGVTVTFAYPGGATLELHQSLVRSARIRNIRCAHEQGEVFAAEGYAKVSGQVGVAIATSGPGATNLITGIADAYADSVALLCITGQVPQSLIGLNSFQEVPVADLVRPVVKKVFEITDVDQVAATVLEALHLAESGRPGPVVIDFPKNVQQAKTKTAFSRDKISYSKEGQPLVLNPSRAPVMPDVTSLRDSKLSTGAQEIMEMIFEAKRPVLYVGGGCQGAVGQLRQFVKTTGIPVVQTLMGLGCVPPTDPAFFGMLGMHGTVAANYATHNSDLLLAFGVRFDDRVTGKVEQFAKHAKIVHVDIDRKEIGKIKAVDLSINDDIANVLPILNAIASTQKEGLPLQAHKDWLELLRGQDRANPMHYGTKTLQSGPGGMEEIRPEYAIALLSEMTSELVGDLDNVAVSTGVGQHQMWAAQHFKFEKSRRWITSGGLGAMGFGLPSALGAAVALPKATVIDIDGDGSFAMNIQELATVAVEKLNTKMVILNNQYLGMVFQWENTFYKRQHAHSFTGDPENPGRKYPDFVKIAEGYNVPAMRVFNEEEMKEAYRRMLTTPGPFLVDVVVADNHVYPMIPSMKSFDDIMTEDPEEDAMTSGNDVYPGEATEIDAKIMRLEAQLAALKAKKDANR